MTTSAVARCTPWTQTATGKRLDLINPDPSHIDFANDVAPALAKLARFNGHTQSYPAYSVAQHCVMGAEVMVEALYVAEHTGIWPPRMGALFLLHDAHEAFIGDITTPVVAALDHIRWPDGPPGGQGFVAQLVADLKHRLDVAVYAAAGIVLPTPQEHVIIRRWDARMMRAERLAFMADSPEPWANDQVEPAPVEWGEPEWATESGTSLDMRIWDSGVAAREWMWAFEQYMAAPYGGVVPTPRRPAFEQYVWPK